MFIIVRLKKEKTAGLPVTVRHANIRYETSRYISALSILNTF